MNEIKHYTTAETAKFVRAALKESYPGVTFKVHSKVYSMGCSISVSYFDGPRIKEVESVVAPFRSAYMDDSDGGDAIKRSRDGKNPKTGEPCRYDADFINIRRYYSLDLFRPAAIAVAQYFGHEEPIQFRDSEEWGADIDYEHNPDIKNANNERLSLLVDRYLEGELDINPRSEIEAEQPPIPVKPTLTLVQKAEPRPLFEYKPAPLPEVQDKSTAHDADLERLALATAKECIRPGYFEAMDQDEQINNGLAHLLSFYTRWDGARLMDIAALALEDANFHSEAAWLWEQIARYSPTPDEPTYTDLLPQFNSDWPAEVYTAGQGRIGDCGGWYAFGSDFPGVLYGLARADAGYTDENGTMRGYTVQDGKSRYRAQPPVVLAPCQLCQTLSEGELCPSCTAKVNAYTDKVQRRYERLQAAADKHAREATGYSERAHHMASIMQGEPVKLDHYSAKRHLRDIDRMDNFMRKSIEHYQRSQRLADRAEAARKNRAIRTDDPTALLQLREKLAKLQELQESMVKANRVIRKYCKLPDLEAMPTTAKYGDNSGQEIYARNQQRYKDAAQQWQTFAPQIAQESGLKLSQVQRLLVPDFANRIGFPDFETRNNGAEIRRLQKRIQEMESRKEQVETVGNTSETLGEVEIIANLEENRVQIHFPGKPDEAIRKELRSYGFKWAPSVGAWQRHYSTQALYWAREIVKKYNTD